MTGQSPDYQVAEEEHEPQTRPPLKPAATTGHIDHTALELPGQSGTFQEPFDDLYESVSLNGSPSTPLPPTILAQPESEASSTSASLPPPPTLRQRPSRRQLALIVSIVAIVVSAILLLLPLLLSTPRFTPAAQAPASVGRIVFSSSGQLDPTSSLGLNDTITIELHHLGNPGQNKSFYAWLLPESDQIKPLLLGKFTPTKGAWDLSYQDPGHRNLLATFSVFRVTEEDDASNPVVPTLNTAAWRYEGSIPNAPTPNDPDHFSLLSHMRHLLANEPALEKIGLAGGLEIWLFRNTGKILEYSTAARDGWASGPTGVDLLRRQVFRILQYLDGSNYSWQDTPPGTPWLIDPKAGKIGLLDFTPDQNPPGYLSHVRLHLAGLLNAPGATPEQKQIANRIDSVIKRVTPLYQDIRTDAIRLAKMSNQQILQPDGLSLLNDIANKASAAYAGQTDPKTGQLQPGISWAHGQIQTLATMTIQPVKH
jgi:hypothetical protein